MQLNILKHYKYKKGVAISHKTGSYSKEPLAKNQKLQYW
jgi:hypothetical protein